jgi:hypothetical protein
MRKLKRKSGNDCDRFETNDFIVARKYLGKNPGRYYVYRDQGSNWNHCDNNSLADDILASRRTLVYVAICRNRFVSEHVDTSLVG